MSKINVTEGEHAFEFMTTEFDGGVPAAIYRLKGVPGALNAECPRLADARVASLATELFGRPCEYVDETLSCGTRHVMLRYVDASARADVMERMVNRGVDVEDAAVVSGAEIAWVETPTGPTLRPVRRPSRAGVSLPTDTMLRYLRDNAQTRQWPFMSVVGHVMRGETRSAPTATTPAGKFATHYDSVVDRMRKELAEAARMAQRAHYLAGVFVRAGLTSLPQPEDTAGGPTGTVVFRWSLWVDTNHGHYACGIVRVMLRPDDTIEWAWGSRVIRSVTPEYVENVPGVLLTTPAQGRAPMEFVTFALRHRDLMVEPKPAGTPGGRA